MGEKPGDRKDGVDEISVKVEMDVPAPESVSRSGPTLESAVEPVFEPMPELEPEIEPACEPPPKRRMSKKLVWTVVWVVLGLLLVCAVAVVLVARPYVSGIKALPVLWPFAGDRALVAFRGRRGDDLYLLSPGQAREEGTLLAEDVGQSTGAFAVVRNGRVVGVMGNNYGGFVPGLDWLLFWYAMDEVSALAQMSARADAPTTILDSKGDWLVGSVFSKGQYVFLAESRGGRSRCYVVRPNGKAERIARADVCTVSFDGSTVILEEVYTDETTLSAVSIKGGRETVLLDDVAGVESYKVATDGAWVAYVRAMEADRQLLVVDRRNGEVSVVSDEVFKILDYGFVPGGETLFYVLQEEAEDAAQLYLSTSDRPIAEGAQIDARFAPDGKRIVYLVTDGETGTLHVDPLGEGETRVVLSAAGVTEYEIAHTSPPVLLLPVVTEDGVTVYTADWDGLNVVQVLKEGSTALGGIQYVEGEPDLYVQVARESGERVLIVARVDGSEPLRLLDGWAEIQVLNRSRKGKHLVFEARHEGESDPALYSIAVEAGAEPVALDDEHKGFVDAVFMAGGQSILYTGAIGDAYDAVDVCLAPIDGGGGFEVLYEKAFLIDVRWDDLYPFR